MFHRFFKAAAVSLALVSSACTNAETVDEHKAPEPVAAVDDAPSAPAHEVASYSVPDLNGELAAQMAQALSGVAGVVKASPRIGDQLLDVEFTPKATTPEAILAALKTVSQNAEQAGVRGAEPDSEPVHGCGGCPYKNECGGE